MTSLNAATRGAAKRAARKAVKAVWKTAAAQARVAAAATVNLDPTRASQAELQQKAIDGVRQCLDSGTVRPPPSPASVGHDAAVILASRSLAAWLHDDAFVSRMLAATGLTNSASKELDVMVAAVDEVPRYDAGLDHFGSSEGISVLRGISRRVLPSLWMKESARMSTQPASLKFRVPPTYWPGLLSVEVPLANTIFANGRPHTLSATRWRSDPHSLPTLTERLERAHQTILLEGQELGFTPESFSTVAGHLVPVTAPRKVLRALGNILSQVEIDGQPAPASKELEAIIPSLLEQRRKIYGENHPAGPIGVWALVMQRRYVEEGRPILEPLQVGEYRPEDELRLARSAAEELDWLLSNRGRLHRVLSGGGGWGPKTGLLSLDTQTTLAKDEERDMEAFIGSFKQTMAGVEGKPPRTYVQFFVEAAYPTEENWVAPSSRRWDPADNLEAVTAVLGTPAGEIDTPPLDVASSCPGLFGGVSAEGVYLAKKDGSPTVSPKLTKMDTPRSYVISHKGFSGPAEPIRSRALQDLEQRRRGFRTLNLDQPEEV